MFKLIDAPKARDEHTENENNKNNKSQAALLREEKEEIKRESGRKDWGKIQKMVEDASF